MSPSCLILPSRTTSLTNRPVSLIRSSLVRKILLRPKRRRRSPGGYVAKYLGAVFKRAEPAGKDYKTLKSGDEVSCTIDLGQYYEFASESDDNSYKIKYSVTAVGLSPKASTSGRVLESLESNVLTIKMDAGKTPTRALRERKLQSRNNFQSCDTARQSMLVEARSRAYSASRCPRCD